MDSFSMNYAGGHQQQNIPQESKLATYTTVSLILKEPFVSNKYINYILWYINEYLLSFIFSFLLSDSSLV